MSKGMNFKDSPLLILCGGNADFIYVIKSLNNVPVELHLIDHLLQGCETF